MRNHLRRLIMIYAAALACCCGAIPFLQPGSAHATDCSDVGDNSINDALVANLQQQAAAAEQRAAMAGNPRDRARWEATARSLEMQAQSAQSRQQALGGAARRACEALLNKGNSNTDDDD